MRQAFFAAPEIAAKLGRSITLDRLRSIPFVMPDGTVRVEYAPDGYRHLRPSTPAAPVAFEAVWLPPAASTSVVSVEGDFPSSAAVVVTDRDFRVLAASRTAPVAEGHDRARVRIPAGDGDRLVLVRDPRWVKPMTFEVRVDR
jgi:hypothetical protein